MEVLLGSSSLDDIIARLDAIERFFEPGLARSFGRSRRIGRKSRHGARRSRTSEPTRRGSSPNRPHRSSPSNRRSPSRTSCSRRSRTRSRGCARRRRGSRRRSQRRRVRVRCSGATRQPGAARCHAADSTTRLVVTPTYDPNLPAARYGGVVRDRTPVPRRALRLGRRKPVDRIRLLRLRELTSSHRSACRSHSAPRRIAVRLRDAGARTTSSHPATRFFSGLGHVGIYIGGGQFVHAPHTGDVVKIS